MSAHRGENFLAQKSKIFPSMSRPSIEGKSMSEFQKNFTQKLTFLYTYIFIKILELQDNSIWFIIKKMIRKIIFYHDFQTRKTIFNSWTKKNYIKGAEKTPPPRACWPNFSGYVHSIDLEFWENLKEGRILKLVESILKIRSKGAREHFYEKIIEKTIF